nr:hypothetical protein [Paracoccus saliphilus]
MATVLVICALLALFQAMALPRAYQAIAMIQVQPTLLSGGVDNEDTANRLRLIEQRIMARSNVLDMMSRYNLYEDAPELNEDERVAQFREDVRINFISAVGGIPGAEMDVSALQVTVRAGRSADAANIANDIVRQILSGNAQARGRRLADLVDTLQSEDQRALQEIATLEAEVLAYRNANIDRMPENLEYLMAEQTRLESQRSELIRSLQELERERLALEVGTPELGRPAPVAQQLRVLEVDLAQARRTLAPDHPEVQRLERQIESLRAGEQQLLAPGLSRQVNLIRDQVVALDLERADIERRLPIIKAHVAGIPAVSEQLADYARRLAALEVPRAAIAERLSQAQLDQRLVSGDHGQQMVLLESATEPEYPMSSGRRRVAVLGLGLSLAMSLLSGFALELSRPVLRTRAQVKKFLGVEPISMSPYRPSTRAQLAQRARDVASLAILGSGAAVAVAIVLQNGS